MIRCMCDVVIDELAHLHHQSLQSHFGSFIILFMLCFSLSLAHLLKVIKKALFFQFITAER